MIPTPRPDTTDLIDSDRIRTSLRRLFSGDWAEILGELFQNSQRAQARHVTLTTIPDGFCYADDEHGLQDGPAGFHTLLRLAASAFTNPTIAAQDPMGLGIHSLPARADLTAVTFESGGYHLTVDPARWWTDPPYYTTWADRLIPVADPRSGLRIAVTGPATLPAQLRAALVPNRWGDHPSPAQGYGDLLTITLDGQPVETGLPTGVRVATPLIDTHYAGNRLQIGFVGNPTEERPDCQTSTLNWYGQLIPGPVFAGGFRVYLEVRQGRPLNPRAPTRQGVIADAALAAFQAAVGDHVFGYLADPATTLTPGLIQGAYALNPQRAATLPYVVIAPWPTYQGGGVSTLDESGPPELCRRTALPLLVEPWVWQVAAADPTGDSATEGRGITTFTPDITAVAGPPYRLLTPTPLPVQRLWWQPGAAGPRSTVRPGVWGLSTAGDPPAQWHPVTAPFVLVLEAPSGWDVADVEWTVGTTDLLAFYSAGCRGGL